MHESRSPFDNHWSLSYWRCIIRRGDLHRNPLVPQEFLRHCGVYSGVFSTRYDGNNNDNIDVYTPVRYRAAGTISVSWRSRADQRRLRATCCYWLYILMIGGGRNSGAFCLAI
jgi:hypothetical protein